MISIFKLNGNRKTTRFNIKNFPLLFNNKKQKLCPVQRVFYEKSFLFFFSSKLNGLEEKNATYLCSVDCYQFYIL